MSQEFIEAELNSYQRYQELGGIINEKDFDSALSRLEEEGIPRKTSIKQAEGMARFAGIELDVENGIDKRVKLYAILRSDVQPENEKYHHSQMTDQRLFVEALRMLGDADSLGKMIRAYPHISFDYRREDSK